MAAGAYGAVGSLMHLLDNLQHPSRQQLQYDRDQIKTLSENATFLLEFLEDYSEILCRHTETEDLARQLAYAVDEAEEIIDCHVVDQLSQRSAYGGLSSFREDIDNALNKIESIKKELMMVKDRELVVSEPQQRVPQPIAGGSSTPPSSGEINKMVGFDERLAHIMDELTGHESDRLIIPITGMGGIGKTTLALNAFAERRIVEHFDLCKWITISQSYSIEDVLLDLLGKLDNNNKNEESKEKIAELGGQLYQMLFGKRYLIVMDDVWSAEVWDKLGLFFPNNKNRSRIIVTTRLSDVAISLGTQNPYLMDFLDEEKSWILFCIKAFGKEVCLNPEFEKIGKSIVKCCQGLPLAIAVIGGLLRKSNTIREDWELVAKDVTNSLVNSKDDGDCSNILFLSYKHLPIHLKPCFLYMRVFREDYAINVEKLINYWIVEGFVKRKGSKTLEDIALEYLKDLIDRNLILIQDFSIIGDVYECKMHDLLRDLCKREYEKEHFFCFSKVRNNALQSPRNCFLCSYREASEEMIYLPRVSSISPQPATPATCFVCKVCNILCAQHNRLRLVMIDADGDLYVDYPTSSRVRYLSVNCELESTSLSLLWNLQYLRTIVPVGILCEMPQLRTLITRGIILVDPPVTQICSEDCVILENLQTLVARHFRGSNEILKRIPNVKTLYIEYDDYDEQSEEVVPPANPLLKVVDLHKLETFYCKGVDLECMSFPNSLKFLRLEDCSCPWEKVTIIGSLPNLESLSLDYSHGGPEWNPIAGEFLQLKTLFIVDNADLVQWNAEKYHFPKLQKLDLDNVKYLEKIPPGIGEIETLRQICLTSATESLIQSAEEIIEEQREYGNEELQLILE